MSEAGFDVFISYRRETGADLARLLYSALRNQNLSVFLDVRESGAGLFDNALRDNLARARNVVVVLTRGALDRCRDPEDWFRQEIALAIKAGSNVVPLRAADFEMPDASELPEEIRPILQHQMVGYSHEHSEASIARLKELLQRRTGIRVGPRTRALAMFILLVGFAAYFMVSRQQPTLPPESTLPPLSLSWAGYGKREPLADHSDCFVLHDEMTVFTDDRFRIEFTTNEDCYFYVVLIDSSGELSLLFPHEKIQLSNRCEGGRHYVLPGTDAGDWYRLDDVIGQETVVLVGSYDPLADFDHLRGRIEADPLRPPGPDAQPVTPDEVFLAMRDLEVQAQGDTYDHRGVRIDRTRSIKVETDPTGAPACLVSLEDDLQLRPQAGLLSVLVELNLDHVARP